MHLPPEIWGPIFWATLHITSLAYPDTPTYSEKKAAKEFFNSLVFLLPCPVCREHFKEVIQAAPVESWLDSRQSLMEWVWQIHNAVNTRLGKPAITMAEFLKRYNEMAERGLPIPPASPTGEISQELLQNEYIKGAFHGLMGIAVVGVVGGLLWASYNKN
jgi:hypothetical protein